jgi:adenine/guanine phosphoribosyltransferase-like PRPP-binding protein
VILIASLLHLCASYVISKSFPGVEARGFMFGPSIALAIGAKFVPLRKPRKLPGKLKLIGASKLSFQLC